MFTITLIIGVLSLIVVRAYLAAETGPGPEALRAAAEAALRAVAAERATLPGWVDDEARTEGFTEALVAHLRGAGLGQVRIEAALTDADFRIGVVSFAAHLETTGADYLTQRAAACDFALELLSAPGPVSAGSPRNRAPEPPRSSAAQPDANG